MEVPDLISKEVWEKARKAFENHENWVAYNNTLLFVHETDIHFFTNQEDAAEFADGQISEFDNYNIVRMNSLGDFQSRVENVMPGLVYKPVEAKSVVNETEQSFLKNKTIIMNTENMDYLKNTLKFLGFDEGLNTQLEQKIKEGKPAFTLDASTEFGTDKMQAVIHFRHSEKEGWTAWEPMRANCSSHARRWRCG